MLSKESIDTLLSKKNFESVDRVLQRTRGSESNNQIDLNQELGYGIPSSINSLILR